MTWVRIDTGIMDDPAVHRIATDIGRDVPSAVGYVTCVLAKLPAHAREGDLSDVPDSLVEVWAQWRGKRGAFARAFLTHMCDGRQVKAWAKHNGTPLREADEAKERMRQLRQERRANAAEVPAESKVTTAPTAATANGSAPRAPNTEPERSENTAAPVRRTVRRTNDERSVLRNERNVRNEDLTTTATASDADASAAPVVAELPVWLVLHAEWEKRVGPIDKGRFRKAFKPLCEPGEGAPLPYPVAVLRTAVEWYAAIRRGTREWGFVKPETFVGGVTDHVRVAQMDIQDRVRRLPLPAGAA